jgi:hypothetical protein
MCTQQLRNNYWPQETAGLGVKADSTINPTHTNRLNPGLQYDNYGDYNDGDDEADDDD